jgi:hypothetical protein
LARTVAANSLLTANWHGIPTAKEDVVVTLSADFLQMHVIEPYFARVAVTFEDKLTGTPAHNSVDGFAIQHNIEVKIQKSFQSGFHCFRYWDKILTQCSIIYSVTPLVIIRGGMGHSTVSCPKRISIIPSG